MRQRQLQLQQQPQRSKRRTQETPVPDTSARAHRRARNVSDSAQRFLERTS